MPYVQLSNLDFADIKTALKEYLRSQGEFTDFDFEGIEPFTIILADWNPNLTTYELVWDGKKKHLINMNQEPRIWSSSTLYTKEEKALREKWFNDWLIKQEEFNQEKILKFHHNSDLGTKENSPKMKRWYVETVSVTSVKKEASETTMNYQNLL